MTKVKVAAGACGFTSVIKVKKKDRTRVAVQIFSACKIIRSMAEDIQDIEWMNGVYVRKMPDSIIYQSVIKRLVHTDCPVPSAILKAILIEVDAMLPKEVSMKFEKSKDDNL